MKLTSMMVVFILLCETGAAQLTVIQGASMGMTPEQLVREHLVGKGVVISNVTLNGSAEVISNNHIGYFQAAGGARIQLGMENGIVMTSGRADYAIGPNDKANKSFGSNTGSDPDLEQLTGYESFDVCILEFDFIPQCDTMRFRYVFGSEELYEFCEHNINDAFGFLLSGPGIYGYFSNNSLNIARMPGGSEDVTIRNICDDASSAWNNQSGSFLQYDAMTWVLTAWHLVAPYQQYHLKLLIGDAIDQSYDSGVFLEKGSFSSGFEFNVSNIPLNPSAGQDAVEACNDVAVVFRLPRPAQSELQIDFIIDGTATNGIDYAFIPDSVIIQPGQDSAAVMIHPLPDGISERPETVILRILQKTCYDMLLKPDTVTILDNSTMSVSSGSDMTICPGDSVNLVASVTGGFGPFTYTWNCTPATDSMIMVKPGQPSNIYVVEVTDRCMNSDSDTLVVGVEPIAFLTCQPVAKAICSGEATGIHLTSNISRASFSWEPIPVSGNISGHSPGTGNIIDQTLTTDGAFPALVDYHIRVTGNGCDTSWSDFSVTVNPAPVIELGDAVYMMPGSTIRLTAGGGFQEYLWSTGSSDSLIETGQPGIYWVRVTNEYACFRYDTVVVNEFGLNIPNAITPNGDGLNDRFFIMGFEQSGNALLQIFNRWGDLIFETWDLDKGWNGATGDGTCHAETYVWIIRFTSGYDRIFKGTVTVVL